MCLSNAMSEPGTLVYEWICLSEGCGMVFTQWEQKAAHEQKTMHQLRRHELAPDIRPRPPKCMVCGNDFPDEMQLANHAPCKPWYEEAK